jgi:nitrogen fixation-related uncharacterized protein
MISVSVFIGFLFIAANYWKARNVKQKENKEWEEAIEHQKHIMLIDLEGNKGGNYGFYDATHEKKPEEKEGIQLLSLEKRGDRMARL